MGDVTPPRIIRAPMPSGSWVMFKGYNRDKYSWFCRCETPDADELHSCRVCFRLVYRDDY